MRQLRFSLFVVAIAMFMTSFSSFSFAESDISISKPAANSTYYKGESIPVQFTCKDTVGGSLECVAELYNAKNNYTVLPPINPFADENPYTFDGKENSKRMVEGTYTFRVQLKVEHIGDVNETQTVSGIAIKTLKAPAKIKIKVGKKKATITYKKATGATAYEIYRSTKKSGKYTKVATTTKLKYVDKKLKKGKKYYYKVRSKRDKGNGVVYSAYRGPIKSKKVK